MALLALLLGGVLLRPIDLGEEIRDVRVADLDANGVEDVVAVGAKSIFLLRGGRAPVLRHPAPALAEVGRGLFVVVQDDRAERIADPFGDWRQTTAVRPTLVAMQGAGLPALLASPGDLDGDGRDERFAVADDALYLGRWRIDLAPEAQLGIRRNETLGVEYRIPVPSIGDWTGARAEAVFYCDGELRSYREGRLTRRIPLALPARGREAESIRRNHVLVRDVDGDGRLDLMVVVAKGATGLFASFEATARLFRGGRIYDGNKHGFYRPVSFLKVAGALMRPHLLDLDSDGDLDLVLATINTSLLAAATGTAPGTYHLFRFDKRAYARQPAWTYRAPVPLSALTEKPEPPVRFLPDLDGNGRPEALVMHARLRLLEADRKGRFRSVARLEVGRDPGPLATGGSLAAVACGTRLVIVGPAE